MRVALALLIGLLLGACCSHVPAAQGPSNLPADHSALAANVEAKSVALVRDESGETRAYCAGTWVSGNRIVTAEHCVPNATALYVVPADVLRTPVYPRQAQVLRRDEVHDVALLAAQSAPDHGTAYLTSEPIRKGMFVQAIGSPMQLWFSYSSGDVAGTRWITVGEHTSHVVQATVPISLGSSGGALLDVHGNIVGVTVGFIGSDKGASNVGFFAHYDYVDALMSASE